MRPQTEVGDILSGLEERIDAIGLKSAWETLRDFGLRKLMKVGMIAVLHTWGHNLSLHPHLHCIIPDGGTVQNGKL
jgi:hypothetical protein